MKNKLLPLLVCLCLTACATQTKYIAAQCSKPVLMQPPIYMPITDNMTSPQTVKALVVNYRLCQIDAMSVRKQCGDK